MKKDKLYLGLVLGLVGVLFTGFMAVKVVPNIFVTLTKASPASKVSLNDSYLLGGSILAKADGIDKCVVNVFVLDKSGKGVSGKEVNLSGMPSGDIQSISDKDGKASFEVTSKEEGQFELVANIGGVPLARTMKITFRN